MAYLSLSPQDYETLSDLCRSLDLSRHPFHTFKRLLHSCLADGAPQLAGRVAALGKQHLQLLYNHLRERPHVERGHGLTGAEVEVVAEAGVPLLSQARFVQPLKRALARRLAEWHADLAVKVERLSLRQFGVLCEEVRDRARGKS